MIQNQLSISKTTQLKLWVIVTNTTSDKKLEAQKQPSRGVLTKMCSENMQQIYRRTLMPKCDLNKVAK